MSVPHLPTNRILVGDACQRLKELPDASIDCVITSPPYFALRDYQHEGQLGLESTVDEWVHNLANVCDDIARVLKPTGSMFLNVADGYSSHVRQGATFKSLLLGPQKLAIELAKRGWIIRNQIVWSKRNPMPSSVADRFSNAHEVVLFCVRSRFYHFDLDPIREQHATPMQPKRPKSRGYQYLPDDAVPIGAQVDLNLGLSSLKARGLVGHPLGGNPKDVWHLPTAAYHGAHFATFPVSLIEKPLLAGCPERVCDHCGIPWKRRPVDRKQQPIQMGPLFPGCDCNAPWSPGIVLDPFMGSGTLALAAEMHRRRWVGVELKPEYIELAQTRLSRWRDEQQLHKHKERTV